MNDNGENMEWFLGMETQVIVAAVAAPSPLLKKPVSLITTATYSLCYHHVNIKAARVN